MEVKTIKDVDPAVWAELKGLAARSKLPMGKMLAEIVRTYRTESERAWNKILNHKPSLTEAEANAMLKRLKHLRREPGFR